METNGEDNNEGAVGRDMVSLLTKLADPQLSSLQTSLLLNITKLNLPACGLSSLPEEFCSTIPNISILFCPKNDFEELPAVIGRCPSLQMVSFKANKLRRIHPDALQAQLRWLILTENCLSEIPSEIGRCSVLQKLMLSGNKIKALPDEIGECTNLELVRLAANDMEAPPISLLKLPKLAWIALSDNTFTEKAAMKAGSAEVQLQILDDPNLEREDALILGQGASGVTRKVCWQGTDVAVKTYAGKMTSDGNPQTEKRLSLIASSIPTSFLIRVKGQTPQGRLVMEWLQNFEALAGPPSLESCSRDVYNENQCISGEVALYMVQGLAETLASLHAKGISHGDFYSHNILVSNDVPVQVKLSDFGAAFFYDRERGYGQLIERIEMRAFSIFVAEVKGLLEPGASDVAEKLQKLADHSKTSLSFEELVELYKRG